MGTVEATCLWVYKFITCCNSICAAWGLQDGAVNLRNLDRHEKSKSVEVVQCILKLETNKFRRRFLKNCRVLA